MTLAPVSKQARKNWIRLKEKKKKGGERAEGARYGAKIANLPRSYWDRGFVGIAVAEAIEDGGDAGSDSDDRGRTAANEERKK